MAPSENSQMEKDVDESTTDKQTIERRNIFNKYKMGKILGDLEKAYKTTNVDELVNISIKTKFLFTLMKKLKEEGHKMLVFSMSKAMLDLLERIINGKSEYKKNYKYLRIDGDTEIDTREGIC